MSTNEVIQISSTGGQKAGNNVRASLLPWKELLEVAELYGKGAEKYEANNWMKGYEWSQSYDALVRHLGEWWLGNEYDNGEGGTGLEHLTAVIFHAFALMYFRKHFPQFDDRPSTAMAQKPDLPPLFASGGVVSGLSPNVNGILAALNDANLTISYSPESSCSIISPDHPTEVDSATLRDEQWTRQYEWRNFELAYRWHRNGAQGDGWYYTDTEDDEFEWEWSSVNYPGGNRLSTYTRP